MSTRWPWLSFSESTDSRPLRAISKSMSTWLRRAKRAVGDDLLDQPSAPRLDRPGQLTADAFLRLDPLGDRVAGNVRRERQANQGLVEMHMAVDKRLTEKAALRVEARDDLCRLRAGAGAHRGDRSFGNDEVDWVARAVPSVRYDKGRLRAAPGQRTVTRSAPAAAPRRRGRADRSRPPPPASRKRSG